MLHVLWPIFFILYYYCQCFMHHIYLIDYFPTFLSQVRLHSVETNMSESEASSPPPIMLSYASHPVSLDSDLLTTFDL